MNRTLRHLLIAAALVFTQQAAQLHALSHLKHDLVKSERGGQCIPPVNHPAEQCIAFHAVDSVLAVLAPAIDAPQVALPEIASFSLPLPFAPRIEFDPRAPPALS
ncbi:MAG TPA: hypothetical protein VK572_17270 [Burkholderiales bacterium]|nr:hypothetical protein [Burkholderiales bacterium]